MISDSNQEQSCNENGGSFHMIQPHRDLEVNWGIDIAKNLENYLLKIYSAGVGNDGHSIDFAEAALLLEGSVQVYSRKVEYLHSLVRQAVEFFSQISQPEQPKNVSEQPEVGGESAASSSVDDFWVPDEIEVDPNRNLPKTTTRDDVSFVRPPADLLVFEGDGLDATGDGGSLESYTLATSYIYKDFLLLDPRDVAAVDDYLKGDDEVDKGQDGGNRGNSWPLKSCKQFPAPTKQSGGSAHNLSVGRSHDANLQQSSYDGHGFGFNNPHSPPCNIHESNNDEFAAEGGYILGHMDDSDDEDDPWKPLNPNEPGNLEVKPFRKVEASIWNIGNSSKQVSVSTDFPEASLDGPISADLTQIWEALCRDRKDQQQPQSPPFYEKLRQSLVLGGLEKFDAHPTSKDGDEDSVGGYNSEDNEFEPPIFDMAEGAYINEDIPHEDGSEHEANAHEHENPIPEDLCHSHLNSLLANMRLSEMQTDSEARISAWKQSIEQDLEEHDARPAFDVHDYSERVLDTLSRSFDNESAMSFADVVRGQEKHDVARSFSAILQLMNNGNVDLQTSVTTEKEATCYTAEKPFSVKLLRPAKRRHDAQLGSSQKRSLPETKNGESEDESGDSGEENRDPSVSQPQ
ncbi:hypothetical protein ACET3Z_024372 [Daucus carota]